MKLSTTESDAVLEARDLTVSYSPRGQTKVVRAVDGVNLSLGHGEILALVGESGCGKTTLARTLLGLERPVGGEIRHNGKGLRYSTKALKAFRRQVQLILQDPTGALNPRHTIYQLVAQGLRIHRTVAALRKAGDTDATEVDLVSQALSASGLRPPERFFNSHPHELSGGQRQRVVIAGALTLGPSVLIADEPVSSLDASVRGEILLLFLRLREERGLSVLVVTHDLALTWNVADRIAVMYLGRIMEIGPAERVLTNPQHPYTQALIGAAPEGGGEGFASLPGDPPDAAKIPSGCRFRPRCPRYADGTAQRRGVAQLCESEEPGVLPLVRGTTPSNDSTQAAACWLPGLEKDVDPVPSSVRVGDV